MTCNYNKNNFVSIPVPGDKLDPAIRIYNKSGEHVYSIEPYITTFTQKSRYIYIIVQNNLKYNQTLDFCSTSEAVEALAKLNKVKKIYLDNSSSEDDFYSKDEIDNLFYTKTQVDQRLESVDVSGVTYTGDSDINIGGINQGDLFIDVSMQDMWYDLLHPYQTPTFTFNSNLPTTVEVGTELNSVYTFTWNTINPANVTDNTINLTGPNGLNLTSLDTTGVTNLTINISNTIPTSETWTLNGTDTQGSSINDYETVNWRYKRFYGTSSNSNIIDSEILLLNSEFSTTRLKTWEQNGNGEYIYYCYPSSFGDNEPNPPFLIGNLPNSGWLKTIKDVVISTGEIVEYIIYRSVTIQNGSGIEIQKL